MTRTLILNAGFFAGDDYYSSRLIDRGVFVAHSLKPQPHLLMRVARRIHFRTRLPKESIWFEPWEHLVDDADIVLIEGADLTIPATRYIRSRWPKKRIICWYWNPSGRAPTRRSCRPMSASHGRSTAMTATDSDSSTIRTILSERSPVSAPRMTTTFFSSAPTRGEPAACLDWRRVSGTMDSASVSASPASARKKYPHTPS